MIRRTPTVERVMRALLERDPQHGYELAPSRKQSPTTYRTLARLRDAEWIVEQLELGTRRRMYSLTDLGRERARAWFDPHGERPAQYRTRERLVWLVQWTGSNFATVAEFVGADRILREGDTVFIRNAAGNFEPCRLGWWIDEGIHDPFPIPPDTFAAKYERP